MLKKLKLLLTFLLILGFSSWQSMAQPARVILFTIDGWHHEAPDRLKMPHFNQLKKEGTYIKSSTMILPHHPTVGEYGKMMTTSFPNPVLHSGTIFLEADGKFIQHMWNDSNEATAFLTNCLAYKSIAPGFTDVVQDEDLSDDQTVLKAQEMLSKKDYQFMRIHLQTVGNEGRFLSDTDPEKPYFRNIYGNESPYVKTLLNNDCLLGQFVAFLKKENLYDDTLLIITSDHGQSLSGWHPITDDESWKTPLLFIGKGIAKGRELAYFDHTNITPTICHLMNKPLPNTNGATGHFVPQIMDSEDPCNDKDERILETINQQVREYNMLRSKLFLRAQQEPYYGNLIALLENSILTPEPFYHQDRFTEWHLAGNLEHLVEANEVLLKRIKKALEDKATSK